tara:strand:- start:27 stop:3515 length:3489 start_codon:yes stop_codon:yes gene_type:complete
MPFVRDPEEQIQLERFIPKYEQQEEPTALEIAGAAFRQYNTIGSVLSQERGLPKYIDDRSFNPYDYLTEEEKLDEVFTQNVVFADTEDEINAVRRQTAQERQDRETLARGGALSFFIGAGTAIADPINFIPIGGATAKTYKAGNSIFRSAAVTASVSSATVAAQEAALHASQIERTYGESAVNVSAAAFLGGALGIGAGKVSQYLNGRQLKEIDEAMDVEVKLAKGEDTVISYGPRLDADEVRASFIDELKVELTSVAGNKLTRGEEKALRQEAKALKERINLVEELPEAIPTIKDIPARQAKKEAIAAGKKSAEQERQLFQEQLSIINGRISANKSAKEAEANLSRLEQDIVPQEYQQRLDNILAEEQRIIDQPIAPGETPTLGQMAQAEGITPDELSVGAAQVANGEQVQGKKVRAFMKKAMRFDPLSRTITSDNPIVRSLSNTLAENPIAMDRGGITAVESLIKIHDGKYVSALEAHLKQFKLYKQNGGKLKRREFNEAVSKAMRNDVSEIPEALASSRTWRSELYDPLKNEAISVGLLPEDVDVSTAVNYLNRRWNKDKIAANQPDFEQRVAKWLKDEDLKLFSQAKQAQDDIATATGAEKTRLQKLIDRAEYKKGMDLAKQEYIDIARQIAQRIKGSPDGRLPYDWKIGDGSSSNNLNGTALRGPLRSRTFQIPDNMIDDFLDNDVEDLGRIYLHQIAPDVELKRAFGDVELTDQIANVENWYSMEARKLKTEKKRRALDKQRQSDIGDIAAMRDRIRGVYGMDDPNSFAHRAFRVARNLNYMRLMGGVVASSVPDVARIFMAEGFTKTFSKGLMPLAKNLKTFKVSAAEAKRYGVGVDALMRGRSQIIADVSDYTRGGTAFERGVQSLTDNFGRINLMDYWTAGVKQLHAVTMQNSVIDGLLKGKIDKRLSRLGIDDANATNITKQLEKYAEKVDGVWISNARNWDSPELERIWGAALRKESDRVIVVPGQEKPLFMSTPLSKTVMQFRSFMLSSTQRMTIAAMQNQEHNTIGGLLLLTSMGTMSYAFKQWDAGREISDDPATLIVEGIDRSGSLGAIMELNNTVEKLSSGYGGLRPLLGIDVPAARFASRSAVEAALGPTFGSLLDTTMRVGNAGLSEDDWSDSDTRALRRLLPGQNLTFVRQGLDKVEKSLGDL